MRMTAEQEPGRLRQQKTVVSCFFDYVEYTSLLVASGALCLRRRGGCRKIIGGFRGGGEPGGRWHSVSSSRQLPSAGGLILKTDGGKPGLYKVPVQSAPLADVCAEAALRVLRDYVLSSAISERLAWRRPRPGG